MCGYKGGGQRHESLLGFLERVRGGVLALFFLLLCCSSVLPLFPCLCAPWEPRLRPRAEQKEGVNVYVCGQWVTS